jgi:hypothetical protein
LIQRKRDKICIVGFASGSRMLAPFDDQSFDIACLNHGWNWIPRYDVWYELHTPTHARKISETHWQWLIAQPGPDSPDFKPIYMQDHYPEIPASVKFPMAEVDEWLIRRFGSEGGYYTSSISQMLSHTMWLGYKEIHLYGIDLLEESEHAYQRPGAEYLIGLARGCGIKVYVPKQSALLKANYIYGITEPPDPIQAAGRIAHAKTITQSLEADKALVVPHFHTFDGSLQALKLCKTIIQKNAKLKAIHALPEIEKELDKAIEDMENKRLSHLINLKQVEGAHNVAQSFVSWLSHEARGGTLQGST